MGWVHDLKTCPNKRRLMMIKKCAQTMSWQHDVMVEINQEAAIHTTLRAAAEVLAYCAFFCIRSSVLPQTDALPITKGCHGATVPHCNANPSHCAQI